MIKAVCDKCGKEIVLKFSPAGLGHGDTLQSLDKGILLQDVLSRMQPQGREERRVSEFKYRGGHQGTWSR